MIILRIIFIILLNYRYNFLPSSVGSGPLAVCLCWVCNPPAGVIYSNRPVVGYTTQQIIDLKRNWLDQLLEVVFWAFCWGKLAVVVRITAVSFFCSFFYEYYYYVSFCCHEWLPRRLLCCRVFWDGETATPLRFKLPVK